MGHTIRHLTNFRICFGQNTPSTLTARTIEQLRGDIYRYFRTHSKETRTPGTTNANRIKLSEIIYLSELKTRNENMLNGYRTIVTSSTLSYSLLGLGPEGRVLPLSGWEAAAA